MAFNQKRIVGPITLGTTANSTTLPGSSTYVVPAGETAIVKQIILSNLTSSVKTVTMWVVPHGATASNQHIVFHDLTMQANETTMINLSLVLEESGGTGDEIYARASAASSVNLTVNAVVEDGS